MIILKIMANTWKILKQAVQEFINDNCVKLSASLSYYTIFALGPTLIIIISFAGIFWGREAVQGQLFDEIQSLVGPAAAEQVQNIIINIQQTKQSTTAAIIGIVLLLIGATGVFVEIQSSINYIWSIRAKPKKGWLKFLINRLVSFSLIIGCAFILLVSLVINTVIELLSDRLMVYFENATIVAVYIINTVIIFLFITCLFAIIFKVLPDATVRWKDVTVGAAFTAAFFMVGKFLIGLYLGKSNVGLTYGAAGSIILIISWVYYSSLILYFGAEFTKVYAIRHGSGIKPINTAVFIIKSESKEVGDSNLG
jgi:membrane protein